MFGNYKQAAAVKQKLSINGGGMLKSASYYNKKSEIVT
jgi:hypothetical protein